MAGGVSGLSPLKYINDFFIEIKDKSYFVIQREGKGMKKRKLNGFLAVLLAASMVIGQPMSAYATEAAPIPVETNEEA